jgi:tetratricopeptide (TPR) repeat protein
MRSGTRDIPARLLAVLAVLVAVPSVHAQSSRGGATPPGPAPAPKPPVPSPPAPTAPAPSATPLSDEAELARVTTLYDSGKYAECADQLTQLLNPTGPRPLRDAQVTQRARIYQAACLIGSGQRDRAAEALRAALRADPLMKPPNSLVFPQPVVDEFFRAQEAMSQEIREAEARRRKQLEDAAKARAEQNAAERIYLQELKNLAGQETVIVTNRRSLAFVPFGVGQFQNRDPVLGALFLASEVGLAGATLTSLIVSAHLNEAGKRPDANTPEINQRLEDWNLALQISSYGFIGVAVLGIVEAQLSFKPEFRETRRRPLPRHLDTLGKPSAFRIAPSVGTLPGGAQLGLRALF